MTARRPLGRTDVEVTRWALGTGPIGNLWTAVDDDVAAATVAAAWDAGVRWFDTAPHYGVGLAERRLGTALHGRPRADYVVSTKVGRRLDPLPPGGSDLPQGFDTPATHERVWDFSADGVLRTLDASLERLDLGHVDVVLLHDVGLAPPEQQELAVREAFPVLAELRDEGVVGAVGAGLTETEPLARLVRATDLDVVMLAGRYTLLDQSGADDVIPACEDLGVTVTVAAPFNSGLLAQSDVPASATFDYAAAPPDVVARARAVAEVCRAHGVELPQAALHLPLRHPAVASVVVGLRSPGEVEEAAARLATPVPDALWDDLAAAGLVPLVPR